MDERDLPAPDSPPNDDGTGVPADQAPASAPEPLVNWEAPVHQEIAARSELVEGPPTAARRILRAFAWVVGVAGIFVLGRIYAIATGGVELTAEQAGEVVGTILVALLIGAGIRWLFILVGRARGMLSPWILVIACGVLLVNVGRAGAAGGGPFDRGATQPLSTYVRIDAPYDLDDMAPEEADQFRQSLASTSSEHEVRWINHDGELVGALIVANFDASGSARFLDGMEAGLKERGAEAHQSDLAGRRVILMTAPFEGVTWVEPPYGIVVVKVGTEDVEEIATAVIEAYKKAPFGN